MRRTPEEELTSNMPDISEYLNFGFYDHIWYWNVSKESARVGCWLGVVTTRGRCISYWSLPYSSVPVVCSTVQHITKDETCDPRYQELILSCDKQIEKMMNARGKSIDLSG